MSFFLGYNFRLNKRKHALTHQFIGFTVQDVKTWLAALKHEQKWRNAEPSATSKHMKLEQVTGCCWA